MVVMCMERICAAADCYKKLDKKLPSAKYCSIQCKWRDYKRNAYKARAKRFMHAMLW